MLREQGDDAVECGLWKFGFAEFPSGEGVLVDGEQVRALCLLDALGAAKSEPFGAHVVGKCGHSIVLFPSFPGELYRVLAWPK